jgi:hypothetical protein
MNTLFCNIKVLSQIKESQKLYVNGEHLVIDNSINYGIPISSVTRWWYSENREGTLDRIRKIISESIQNGNNAIRSNTAYQNNSIHTNYLDNSEDSIKLREWELERDQITSTSNVGFLELLVDELCNVISGIEIIKDTYSSDVTLCSKLNIEIGALKRNIEKFKKFLDENKI